MHTIEPVDSRYYLEYTFLPNYFDSLNGNANILTDTEKWHKLHKKKTKKEIKNFDWNKIMVHIVNEKCGDICYLYTFPEPKEIPNCFFICYYIEKNAKRGKYFTLEKSYEILGQKTPIICGVDRYNHQNYGVTVKPDRDIFYKAVRKLAKGKSPEIPNNGFILNDEMINGVLKLMEKENFIRNDDKNEEEDDNEYEFKDVK